MLPIIIMRIKLFSNPNKGGFQYLIARDVESCLKVKFVAFFVLSRHRRAPCARTLIFTRGSKPKLGAPLRIASAT